MRAVCPRLALLLGLGSCGGPVVEVTFVVPDSAPMALASIDVKVEHDVIPFADTLTAGNLTGAKLEWQYKTGLREGTLIVTAIGRDASGRRILESVPTKVNVVAQAGKGEVVLVELDECALNPCQNGGTCVDGTFTPTCMCTSGFQGPLCETPDACSPAPCQNGGTCSVLPVGYSCTCLTGFSGDNCEVDIDECATNNGGCDPLTTCTNMPGSRTCGACPAGYLGSGTTSCMDINECDVSNGGCVVGSECHNYLNAAPTTCGACAFGWGNGKSCTPLGARIVSASPLTAPLGTPMTIHVTGTGFTVNAVAYFKGTSVAVSNVTATDMDVQLGAGDLGAAGFFDLKVRNNVLDPSTDSNVVEIQVGPAPGNLSFRDLNPDYGVQGDTIRIHGNNLAAGTITIVDPMGVSVVGGASGSIAWSQGGADQYLDFVLPANWHSGMITLQRGAETFTGGWFNVGQNLARLNGNTLQVSTEFAGGALPKGNLTDGNLATFWATNANDCAGFGSCISRPSVRLTFVSPQTVRRVAWRGDRNGSDFDFVLTKVELYDTQGQVLWGFTGIPSRPDGDLDVAPTSPIGGVARVGVTDLLDQGQASITGAAELEVF